MIWERAQSKMKQVKEKWIKEVSRNHNVGESKTEDEREGREKLTEAELRRNIRSERE